MTATADPAALEAAAALLARHPDYRVLRRLVPHAAFADAAGAPLARAVVLDTETTGTSIEYDQVIELAVARFSYHPDSGAIVAIEATYEGLEDPERPIPPEATAIHGITDEMVAGKRIDETAVLALLEGATLVIAHNARFDRPFLEQRMPVFASLPWGCSYEDVPWSAEGVPSARLQFLAWHSGFFYEAHRALMDCRALLEVLAHPLPKSTVPALAPLLQQSRAKVYRLWAVNSPFESKDRLRERGYRWDADRRCWHRTLSRDTAADEAAWLKAEVYGGRAVQVEVETLDAQTRFSQRPGVRRLRTL